LVDFFKFKSKEKHSWARESGFEIDRYCHTGCIMNKKMVIFGGLTRETTESQLTVVNSLDEYEIEKESWTRNENASKKGPCPRFMHSSMVSFDWFKNI
jgi:N-acetylneuraminic acid mutarotase